MRDNFVAIIDSAVSLIEKAQRSDGSFWSYTAPEDASPAAFRKCLHTVFFSALISDALTPADADPRIHAIRLRVSKFLLAQKSKSWSFNYWVRGSAESRTMPYPDDLDDTFCALAAIQKARPEAITPAAMAAITKLLISAERQPGGPYRTWLTANPNSVWQDCDIAVNANIAYFLKINNIHLPPLMQYLESEIKNQNFNSPYYPGSIAVLYYLCRSYTGHQLPELARAVSKAQLTLTRHAQLNTALIVSALLHLGRPGRGVQPLLKKLEHSVKTDGFTAQAFCYDPTVQGKPHVAAAESLTAAFCVQAFSMYGTTEKKVKSISIRRVAKPDTAEIYRLALSLVQQQLKRFPQPLRDHSLHYLKKILAQDKDRQIVLLPCWFFPDVNRYREARNDLIKLGAANLYGWIAYAINDAILDREHDCSDLLPLANVLLRRLTVIYENLFKDTKNGNRLFHKIMDTMENANLREQLYCRAVVSGNIVSLKGKPPDIKDRSHFAEKSLGHALGPLTITLLYGKPSQQASMSLLISSLREYIAARQLHDDAHDWLEDLKKGHLTAANTSILAQQHNKTFNFASAASVRTAQVRYWTYRIPKLATMIIKHLETARAGIRSLNLPYEKYIEQTMFDPLERAAVTAKNTGPDTVAYVQQYGSTPGKVTIPDTRPRQ